MSRTPQRSLRGLALAAAIAALAAPPASAIPAEELIPSAQRQSEERQTLPVRVVEIGAEHGFDWGDAGIGASGVLALMAIGAGAAVASGRRLVTS